MGDAEGSHTGPPSPNPPMSPSQAGEGWPAEQERAVREQEEWRWWFKRAVVLHGDKLAGLLAFALALRAPGALGALLVLALCGATTLVGLAYRPCGAAPSGASTIRGYAGERKRGGREEEGEEGAEEGGVCSVAGAAEAKAWVAAAAVWLALPLVAGWMMVDYALQVRGLAFEYRVLFNREWRQGVSDCEHINTQG